MRRSGRGKRGKGKGAAQAAGGFPTTARLLGPSALKCPKAEITMGRVPPVPDNRRFPRETPAAISSRRQGGLFGFDSMPRNHAEKGNQLVFHLRIRSLPYPRGRPETEPKLHASVAIRQGAGNCPAPIAFKSAYYRASSRFHASTRYSSSSRCHASARYRASSRCRAQAPHRTSAPRQRRLQATRPWCPSGRPRTPCPSTKHQSHPA